MQSIWGNEAEQEEKEREKVEVTKEYSGLRASDGRLHTLKLRSCGPLKNYPKL
jgi:hypothetical protein